MSKIYYVNPPYREGCDIFWELLSVLTLPVEQQIKVIGGLPDKPIKSSAKLTDITNSFLFKTALETYFESWVREFEHLSTEESGKQLISGDSDLDNLDLNDDEEYADGIYNDFRCALYDLPDSDCINLLGFYSPSWERVRRLAKDLLIEVDMPAQDINKSIDFDQLVRVFINESSDIQVD